mgnify:CR=1 FL=1
MNLKLSYSVKNFKGLPIIRMNNPNDIGLMQAICKESGGKMIFKTRQNVNLPAQLINTIKPVAFIHQNRLSIIGANSYIAASSPPLHQRTLQERFSTTRKARQPFAESLTLRKIVIFKFYKTQKSRALA